LGRIRPFVAYVRLALGSSLRETCRNASGCERLKLLIARVSWTSNPDIGHLAWRIHHHRADLRQSHPMKADLPCGDVRKVQHPALHVRTAIVDANDDAALAAFVDNLHLRPEGQRPMRRSVGSFVVALAVRGAAPLKTVAVAGRDSSEPVTVERTAHRRHFSAMLRNLYRGRAGRRRYALSLAHRGGRNPQHGGRAHASSAEIFSSCVRGHAYQGIRRQARIEHFGALITPGKLRHPLRSNQTTGLFPRRRGLPGRIDAHPEPLPCSIPDQSLTNSPRGYHLRRQ